jgi:ABC-type multidrug transport system ATPase subunit/pSer/pThr/pTyr-binding forkhead associated (FHA) protein/ABC-type multidrug transport system permease subunit
MNSNSKQVWVFGSDAACNVIVQHPNVSPQHCLLAEYDDGFALEDLGSEGGTWLNNRRLEPRRAEWVKASDKIRLGSSAMLPWPSGKPGPTGSGAFKSNSGRRVITIGRAPDNHAVLDYPMISWYHARLIEEPGGVLTLEDLGSTNGTAVGHAENRIQRTTVTATDAVFFGSFKIRVSRLLEPGKIALGDAPQEQVRFVGDEMTIGRDPDCEHPLNFPMISWRHAKLYRTARGIEVEDLGSRNGTFVDGKRISGRVGLQTGSEVGLGSFRFSLLDAAGNFSKKDYTGNVTIEAAGIVVEIHKGSNRRRLLNPVSLTVYPSELVALMGPAGAGKTTLLKTLNGYTPPNEGRILFNGEDLYAHQEQFRLQVGYVPQDEIMHPQLTVKEALYYTAKLRTDLRDKEIEARVMQVLSDLNIDDIGDRLIGSPEKKVISGGQRKRVNIAMELLSDPSVLFLDEPTSGLSSHDAFQVMQLLRRLADSGKTIITTIHQPSVDIFKQFDSLIMVARDKGNQPGMLVYFGPAYPESIEFFNPGAAGKSGPPTPEMLMSGLAQLPTAHWAGSYEKSPYKKSFVESRTGKVVSSAGSQVTPPKREFGIGQSFVLSARNALLKLRDRMQTFILLAQAPLFAILVGIAFKQLPDKHFQDAGAWVSFCGKVASVHFLMVVAAVWFGCNNAARDIVGETAIFLRERMVNLKLPSYLFSKFTVLAAICIFQCSALLTITYYWCEMKGPFLTLLAVLIVSSLVGAALGLLISALAPTTESAIAFLPVVLLPFILLGGGIIPLHEMPAPAQWVAAVCPTRWGYEANLLAEANARNSEFKSEMAEKIQECQVTVASCQAKLNPAAPSRSQHRAESTSVPIESDIASTAFPKADGRSSLARTFEVLGISLGTLLILILGTLNLKAQR